MGDKLCPYCVNGTSITRIAFTENSDPEIKILKEEGRERAYLETDTRIVELKEFYYCPFCGRHLIGKQLGRRRFRGE